MRATRTYVDCGNPTISTLLMTLPLPFGCGARQAIKARRPAALVKISALFVEEARLVQHEARATWCRFKSHIDHGFVTALAGGVLPRPGEDEAARRIDVEILAAHCIAGAVGLP